MFKNASSAKVVKLQLGRLMAGAAKKRKKMWGEKKRKWATRGKNTKKKKKKVETIGVGAAKPVKC